MSFITPELNATLNTLSAILLCLGYFFIKRGDWRAHAAMMISATVVSALFLACYVTYHWIHGEKSTSTHPGLLRDIYLVILLPHLLLAVVMLPMIFLTLWRAYRRDWTRHRRIAVPTFCIWLYVSITGVIVYFMLYHTSLSGGKS
jgi:uncharacterized membrane protein YozB (DUF420 family)